MIRKILLEWQRSSADDDVYVRVNVQFIGYGWILYSDVWLGQSVSATAVAEMILPNQVVNNIVPIKCVLVMEPQIMM